MKQNDIVQHPYVPEEARCYLKPGIDQEGYWTIQHLLDQIEYKAIPIFEALLHPGCVALFAFDNSTCHAAFGKDALVASKMSLNPGSKQPLMRRHLFWTK